MVAPYYCRQAHFTGFGFEKMQKYASQAARCLLKCKNDILTIRSIISLYEGEKIYESKLLKCIKLGYLKPSPSGMKITDKGRKDFEAYLDEERKGFEAYLYEKRKKLNTIIAIVSAGAGIASAILSLIILLVSLT